MSVHPHTTLALGPRSTRTRVATFAFVLATATAAVAVDHTAPPQARIVNGMPTSEFAAVGILIAGGQFCSATLIGCETVLTAAHCVCPTTADTFAQCRREGGPDPGNVFFLPQFAPMVRARSVTVHPDYDFGRGGDLAVIKLEQPVSGIAPMSVNTGGKPLLGTPGRIVGYGRIGGNPSTAPEVGIKRTGAVVSAQCPGPMGGQPGIPSETHVCIAIADNDDSGTCQGDSGGPLLVDLGEGDVVAGVTSGGSTERDVLDCLPESVSFFTDVFRYRNFVANQLGGDGGPCPGLDPVGAAGTVVSSIGGTLFLPPDRFETTVEVPAGVDALRINMNGEFLSPVDFNDFDLFVNFEAPASASAHICGDTNTVAYGACEVTAPAPGTWHVTVESLNGSGEFQLVSTLFGVASSGTCTGDCDGDGAVRIDELVRGVTIAGGAALSTCTAIDANNDGAARIEELVAAVNAALAGCA